MTSKAYCRCNSGHFFEGEFCPFDGWSSPASRELALAVKRLQGKGVPVTLEALRSAGMKKTMIARIIVVEFGADDAVFDAIAPRQWVVDGVATSFAELEGSYK